MINILTVAFLIVLCSCHSGEKSNTQKVSFGIYETVKVKDIPDLIIDSLKRINIQFENDTQLPIIGYMLKNDSLNFRFDFSKESIRLVKTVYPVDKDDKYYALVAIKCKPLIINSDIKKTKHEDKNVEIYFNMKGARKWAVMTRKNKGNMIAFIIDNELYSVPYINGEIKNGTALISGLENEIISKELSDSLNASIEN